MVKRRPTPPAKPRLSPDDWIKAAIAAVMAGGLDALAVEPLAQQLGTTKGSFYWHFQDRAELLDAVLERWEQLATAAIIDQFTPVVDPRERLRLLLNVVFSGLGEDRFELAVFGAGAHPQIAPVVSRVNRARTAFLVDIFLDLGMTPTRARSRARVAYAAYLGHAQLRLLDPAGGPGPRAVRRYVAELLEMLCTDS